MAEKVKLEVVAKGLEYKIQSKRIQMLEHQIQLCTEDFESERRDRERAQSKIEELEQELRIVHRQVS